MKKFISFVYGVIDLVKEFLFSWGLKILLLLFFGMVVHNMLKMGEITSKYSGEYKHLVTVDEENHKMMNVYQLGEGENTIVILPGFGSQSPALQYKALAYQLKDSYRVAIVEPFGYGYSMGITKERTNENIANEVITALNESEIPGPYIIMAHSMSSMYAMKIQQLYPDSVKAIIALDGVYPAEIKDNYYYEEAGATKTNVNITSILELTGFERVVSYVKPSVFYIDKMQAWSDVYTSDDIKVYRNRIAGSYLTRTMVREINKMADNMTELKDYTYPDYLPVLSILSSERVDEYKVNKSENGAKQDLKELAESVISNSSIQQTVTVEGGHMLQFTNPSEVVKLTKDFLASF